MHQMAMGGGGLKGDREAFKDDKEALRANGEDFNGLTFYYNTCMTK